MCQNVIALQVSPCVLAFTLCVANIIWMDVSGASGRFVPIIMDKQAVDVCPLVCASSWARTFEAEPVSTFLSDEPAIIQAGLRAMTARNLAVCITMRNREDLVPGIRHSIEQKLARLFNSTHVIIIENDSRKVLFLTMSFGVQR